ncbi:hypothetical protein [Lentisalinibacter salinarum]|uniref:hypothetical protein n=1 Tax=Lentisalinibacter salinarum TaxID=2992239 RepID=UPI00386D3710
MTDYIRKSIRKGQMAESQADVALHPEGRRHTGELRHGEWIRQAESQLKSRRFTNPLFALVVVFAFLFGGSLYLFENLPVMAGDPMYAIKITVASFFAVSLGFILSVWWNATSRFDAKLREAERIDREYRELLIGFSDSLFDIINALNTLATKPPKPFVVATELLLGEYIHLLQSQLQRYGDYIAGLGFDATGFLDEKIRIFEGIRERASLSIKGMPKEIESLFVDSLNLQTEKLIDPQARRQKRLQETLADLGTAEKGPELKRAG